MTVRLTWELKEVADSVEVYRSLSTINPNSPGTPIAVLAGNAITYDDSDTAAFTQYFYRVGITLTAPSPDAIALSSEISLYTYDSAVTDEYWENTAILLRFAGDPYTNTLPLNEGYASAAPVETDFSPQRSFYTAQFRNEYQSSLSIGPPGSGNGSYLFLGESPIPSDEFGVDDSFGSTTIDGWVFKDPATDGINSYIMASRTSGVARGFRLYITTTNALSFGVWNSSGVSLLTITSGVDSVSLGEWHHVAAVRNGTRDWELFLDGVSLGTATQTGAAADLYQVTVGGLVGFNPSAGIHFESLRWTVGAARYTAPFTPNQFYSNVQSPAPLTFDTVRGTPYFVGAGDRGQGNGSVVTYFPTASGPGFFGGVFAEGDLLILQIQNDASTAVVPDPPPGEGWLLLDTVTSSVGTAAYPQIRNTLYWRFAGPSEPATTVTPDAAGTIHNRISAWRNVTDVGSPIAAMSQSKDSASNTAYSADGLTTIIDNSLVVFFGGASGNLAWTPDDNADLLVNNLAYEDGEGGGDDGSHICTYGIADTPGAVGAFTGTKSVAGTDVGIVIEMKGVLSTDTPTPVSASVALDVAPISLGGTGLNLGFWDGTAALTTPAIALGGTGDVAVPGIDFVAAGTAARSFSGSITPGLPAGIVADDILLLQMSADVDGTAPNPTHSVSGWTFGERRRDSGASYTVEIWWRRATGSDTAPTIANAGGFHFGGAISAFRGCKTTGSPINTTSVYNRTAGSPGRVDVLTPTVANCMMVSLVAADGQVNQHPMDNWINASLESITQGYSHVLPTDNYGLGMAYGIKAAATVTDQTTCDLPTGGFAVRSTGIGIALEPS